MNKRENELFFVKMAKTETFKKSAKFAEIAFEIGVVAHVILVSGQVLLVLTLGHRTRA